MENDKECFIGSFDGYTYIIPNDLRDKFDVTPSYEREKEFITYVLPDEAIIEEVIVPHSELEALINGDLG